MVYTEVVTFGLQQGYSDAIVVKDSIQKSWIEVQTLNDNQTEHSQMILENAIELHHGEVQTIILAQAYNTSLLMDESSGRALAETRVLKVHGTIYVILQGLRKSFYTKEEAMTAIYSLVEKGFRVEPGIILRVLIEFNSIDH